MGIQAYAETTRNSSAAEPAPGAKFAGLQQGACFACVAAAQHSAAANGIGRFSFRFGGLRFSPPQLRFWSLGGMSAFSITFKLLCLYLALKYGDRGKANRPWCLGLAIALIFSFFDVNCGYRNLRSHLILCVAYLAVALVVMHLYYRVQNVVASLLIGSIGVVTLFFGIPYFVAIVLD